VRRATTHHLDRLGHLEANHDDGEPPPAHGANRDLALLLALTLNLLLLALEALDDGRVRALDVAHLGAAVEDAHVVQLGQEHVLVLCAERVGGRQARDEVRQAADLAADLVVRVVVLAVGEVGVVRVSARCMWPCQSPAKESEGGNAPVLDVVAAHDLDLAHAGVALPLHEVDLLEELLLMVLELAHDEGRGGGGGAGRRRGCSTRCGWRR